MSLFEINGNDIAQLNDADLRNLIGMLCEADYRLSGLSTRGIRYSGQQDASDGGIDVMVEDEIEPPKESFVPRKKTGFQVKKPSMAPSEIKSEMKPDGELRPKIKYLIKQHGAYIIVSSGSNVSDSAYDRRIKAMKEAIAKETSHKSLKVDFFDQGRIATWVRSHPSMILWLRKRIGREVQGWQPYDNWSKSPGGIEEKYILDEKLRLLDCTNPEKKDISISEGLSSLQQKLSIPKISVRLTGLSGTGKTRLVQALFDDRIGNDALDSSLAFYTDMSDNPQPSPINLTEQLSQTSKRAIVIIDNCPPELHRKITEICTKTQSKISLLTVEYDVRDDVPEETLVFKLQTASLGVIEKIILTRYRFINQVDAYAIANFSDGNARVAIALANTFKSGDTLSSFKDEELFKRLFWQRNQQDDGLLQAAEVFSLHYSFEGENTSPNSELATLGKLVGKSADQLFRYINDLKERDLIQSRSKWRAVLPHAIANRLSKRALKAISKDKIYEIIICSDNIRLFKSFTRRLSYLHDSKIAVEIVTKWLAKDGLIGKSISNLSQLGIDILQNIAPVCPDQVLDIIEYASNNPEKGESFTSKKENSNFYPIVKILLHLAYEANNFHRSAYLIARFAASENKNENNNSIRRYFKSLFFLHYSGTHASPKDKEEFIERLLLSDDINIQELGLLALEATLETRHFSPYHESSFGARPRDYGYRPKNQEILPWYETFIKLCTDCILRNKPISYEAKGVLANKIRGLWVDAEAFDALENSVKVITEKQGWNEAWLASNTILKFDSKDISEDNLKRLHKLRAVLKPEDLENIVRMYALTENNFFLELDDNFEDDLSNSQVHERTVKKIKEVGSMLAQDEVVLDKLLPDLVSNKNTNLYHLGQGFLEGCTDKKGTWERLRKQLENTPKEKKDIQFIWGFLSKCKKDDSDLYNEILDEIVDDPILGRWLPIFLSTSSMNIRDLKRLHRSIDTDYTDLNTLRHLTYGPALKDIEDDGLADLLEIILHKDYGYLPVLKILVMRFHHKQDSHLHSRKLLFAGLKGLSLLNFGSYSSYNLTDDDLAIIANTCISENGEEKEVKELCDNMYEAIMNNHIYSSGIKHLMTRILEKQPITFLESFFGNSEISNIEKYRLSSLYDELNENPLNKISDKTLIDWCEGKTEKHYLLMAYTFRPFVISEETRFITWRKIVYYFLENVSELNPILDNLAASIHPNSWSGSKADVLKKRLPLFEELRDYPNEEVKSWASKQLFSLRREIERIRQSELEDNINRNNYESFE